jgi:hypothetical protein
MDSLRTVNDPGELKRSVIASVVVVVAAAVALVVFGPRHDPTKVVAGLPCSVVSESEVGNIFGTQMQLTPSDGTICRYVPTDARHIKSLFVIAQRGGTRYTVHIVPAGPDDGTTQLAEARLAKLIRRPLVATTR